MDIKNFFFRKKTEKKFVGDDDTKKIKNYDRLELQIF